MKKLFISIFVPVMMLAGLFASTVPAYAADSQLKSAACSGIAQVDGSQSCGSNAAGTLNGLLKTAISVLSFVVGTAAVIMIIIGGLRYVTSSGESSNTASAKNTLIYAIVGLIIALLAQVLVHFVLTKSGATIACPSGQKVSGTVCVKA